MSLVFNFAGGLVVGFLLALLSIATLSAAWSLARALVTDRLERDALRRFYRGKTEKVSHWIAGSLFVLFAVTTAIALPAMFIEFNRENATALAGGATALVAVVVLFRRAYPRGRGQSRSASAAVHAAIVSEEK
jgi:hypothetical protein